VMTGQDPFMWEVVGALGTTGEQLTYAFSGVGAHYNNIASLVGGLQGTVELATGMDRIVYPTW
jgi:hypothetical protein